MANNKKIVQERNERKQAQIKQAMNKKPTLFLRHGITPQEIRKNSLKPKTPDQKRLLVSRQPQRPAASRDRPLKASRVVRNPTNPQLLIEVPSAGTRLSVEYPVPAWFRYNEAAADVSVIVPLYKSQSVVNDLIDTWPMESGLKVEIVFVDDCCPNNSKEAVLKAWVKRSAQAPARGIGKIIYNTENKGYGGACNTGAEHAVGKYLVFLNADTRLTPGWLEPMIRLFDDPKVGLVGNLHLKDGGRWHGTIDSAGSEWTWNAMCFVHIGRHSYNKQNLPAPYLPEQAPRDMLKVAERDMVTGCCFCVPASLFRYVGGFNPNYRIGYWEDAELSMVVREMGYKIMFQPESVIYHKLSHTNSGNHEFADYNRSYFVNKWVTSQRIDRLVEDKRAAPSPVGIILLNRRGAHGDVLAAAAVAPALKKMYPGCRIIFSTHCKEVLEKNPYIDKIVDESALSERSFQLYYNLDMVYEFRPRTNILKAYAEAVGVNYTDCRPFLHKEPLFQDLPEDYVVIHPGKTMWVGRDWKHENFEKIAANLLDRGHKVVCVGKSSEFPVPNTVDLRGRTTIAQLATVMSRAKMFIGIDSFPMHVAQTFNIPGVCFFGSVKPETRIYSSNMRPLTAENLPCLGCHHRRPVPCTVTSSCETGTLDCINLVGIDLMWNKVLNVLDTTQ